MAYIKEELASKIKTAMHKPEWIRNIGIVAHIHHGKTTLSDNLLAAAGMISNELAGKQLYLNFDEQEQARCLTINSANVSIVHPWEGKEYLINLIDTPGHVDFGGDVTRAMRAVDGAPLVSAGPSVSVVPAGEADGRYLVDVYVHNVAGLRSYQMTLRAGGGESGRLELEQVTIDSEREDYVFGAAQTVTALSPAIGRLAALLYDGSVDVPGTAYLGTYSYVPSANARGTFRVNVEVSADSLLANAENVEIGFTVGGDARIAVGAPSHPKGEDK